MVGRTLRRSSFARNVAVLMSGTMLGQVVSTGAAPILTRLFTPEAFGVLGLFMATVAIIANVAGLRYELAIVLPKDEDEAVNVFCLAAGFVILVTVLTWLIVETAGSWIAAVLHSPDLAGPLRLAPLYVFAAGIYLPLNYWSSRHKQFSRLAVSRVSRSLGMVTTQLGAGIARAGAGGLVLGQVAGQTLASAVLFIQIVREDLGRIRAAVSLSTMRRLAIRYKDFPRYSTPQAMVNSASNAVPAFVLGLFFGPAVVGFYWFTYRLLMQPSEVIGKAVRQVYFQRAAELHNDGEDVYPVQMRTTLALAGIALLPLLLAVFGGPTLFGLIFGAEWVTAGEYVRWLAVWWFFNFINPPSVMLIPILNLQKQHMIFEVGQLTARTGAIVLGGVLGDATVAIALFALAGAASNAFLVYFVVRTVRKLGGQAGRVSAFLPNRSAGDA